MPSFQFGRRKTTRRQLLLISAVLGAVVALLGECSGVPEERLWNFIDETQRRIWPQGPVNDTLLKDPGVVERRARRDVDRAIEEYERLAAPIEQPRTPPPVVTEKPPDPSECYTEECRQLGGELRICAPWVEGCVIRP